MVEERVKAWVRVWAWAGWPDQGSTQHGLRRGRHEAQQRQVLEAEGRTFLVGVEAGGRKEKNKKNSLPDGKQDMQVTNIFFLIKTQTYNAKHQVNTTLNAETLSPCPY